MKKIISAFFLVNVLFSSQAFAKSDPLPLDVLATTQASQLEMGGLKLDILTMVLNQKFKGQRVGNTRFRYGGTRASLNTNAIIIFTEYKANGRYIDKNKCREMDNASNKMFNPQTLTGIFNLSSLNEKQKKDFWSYLDVRTTLVDEEMGEVKLDCY